MLFHIERGGKKREQRVKGLREHRARGLAIGVKKGKAVIEVFAGKKGGRAANGEGEEEREGNRKRWPRNGNRLSARLLAHAHCASYITLFLKEHGEISAR